MAGIFFRKNKIKTEMKKSRGYTLLEVVLVMAFTSISFMALYGIFAKTIQGDTESQYEIIASNLAQECIERVRNCRDNEVLNDPSGWDISNLNVDCVVSGNISLVSGGKTFSSSASVSAGSNGNLVTCTVSWTSFSQSGLTRSVKIESLLTNWQKQDP